MIETFVYLLFGSLAYLSAFDEPPESKLTDMPLVTVEQPARDQAIVADAFTGEIRIQ